MITCGPLSRRISHIAGIGGFLLTLVACSGDISSTPSGDKPDFCGDPQTCIEFCLCTTDDVNQCFAVCEPGGGGTGSRGGAGGGSGNAGGSGGAPSSGGSPGTGATSGSGGASTGPSCAGKCGSKAPVDGQCHCDAKCVQFNDCCSDYASVCGGGTGGSSGGGGSPGGGGAPGGGGSPGGGGGSGAVSGGCGDDGTGWSSSWQNFECEVLALVNLERSKGASCGGTSYPPTSPITRHQILTTSSRLHAKDMGDKGYFSHTSLDGKSPFQRMKDAGYSGKTMGENIAAGQSSPAAVMSGWMKSPGHCKNIMNGKYKDLGVGYYLGSKGYKHYWVQNFGG